MQQQELLKIVEGIIFASGYEGVTVKQLCELLQLDEASVLALCHTLEERYRQEASGLQLVHVADAFLYDDQAGIGPLFGKNTGRPTPPPACRKPLWRRWPSLPTGSPLPASTSRRFAG